MERVQGSVDTMPIELINRYIGKYRIRWDFMVEDTEEGNMVSFLETEIISKRRPNIAEIKQAVIGAINAKVDKEIMEGFEWNGMKVWLSTENQFNYKAAYDLAIQTGGQTLPVVFKFGTSLEPIYYQFNNLEELGDFYYKAMQYISTTLANGWKMKDNIDWSIYDTN